MPCQDARVERLERPRATRRRSRAQRSMRSRRCVASRSAASMTARGRRRGRRSARGPPGEELAHRRPQVGGADATPPARSGRSSQAKSQSNTSQLSTGTGRSAAPSISVARCAAMGRRRQPRRGELVAHRVRQRRAAPARRRSRRSRRRRRGWALGTGGGAAKTSLEASGACASTAWTSIRPPISNASAESTSSSMATSPPPLAASVGPVYFIGTTPRSTQDCTGRLRLRRAA